jgi:GNAT superfamily N-acetyltransferase
MSLIFRRGEPADWPAALDVMAQSLADFNRRWLGPGDRAGDPVFLREAIGHMPVDAFLARASDQFWVAERDSQVIGWARSFEYDGVRELTQFFVHPSAQSNGVGRELLARAFSTDGVRRRTVLASIDARAQARYLKSGVFPRFPGKRFARAPEPVRVETDLRFQPVTSTPETLDALAKVDRAVLDSRRDATHDFLLSDRQGYLYYRGVEVVGYGYVAAQAGRTGPMALLDASDFPAVLAHAENDAAERGASTINFQVPLVNRAAVTHLLARNYRFEELVYSCMSDEPYGNFEQYLVHHPPIIL